MRERFAGAVAEKWEALLALVRSHTKDGREELSRSLSQAKHDETPIEHVNQKIEVVKDTLNKKVQNYTNDALSIQLSVNNRPPQTIAQEIAEKCLNDILQFGHTKQELLTISYPNKIDETCKALEQEIEKRTQQLKGAKPGPHTTQTQDEILKIREVIIELEKQKSSEHNPLLKQLEDLHKLREAAVTLEKNNPKTQLTLLKRDADNLVNNFYTMVQPPTPPNPAGTTTQAQAPALVKKSVFFDEKLTKNLDDAIAAAKAKTTLDAQGAAKAGIVPPALERLKTLSDELNKKMAELKALEAEKIKNPEHTSVDALRSCLREIETKSNQMAELLNGIAERSALENTLKKEDIAQFEAQCIRIRQNIKLDPNNDHLGMGEQYHRAHLSDKTQVPTLSAQQLGKHCSISYSELVMDNHGNSGFVKRGMADLQSKLGLAPGEQLELRDIMRAVEIVNTENQKKYGKDYKPVTVTYTGGGTYYIDASYAKSPNAVGYRKAREEKSGFEEGRDYFIEHALKNAIAERKASATATATVANAGASAPAATPTAATQPASQNVRTASPKPPSPVDESNTANAAGGARSSNTEGPSNNRNQPNSL